MLLNKIKINPNNPRFIKDDKFKKLVKSINEFPKMMTLRPIVIDKNNIILGGNMRYKALLELEYKEVPNEWVKRADDLTEDEKKRFIIADNVSFGQHDWEVLANEWDADMLEDWGVDLPITAEQEINKEIELTQSLQVLPKKEYIIIIADDFSDEWEELKNIFKCKTVRQGGCKIGSTSDKATTGLERVFTLKEFKNRVGI